MSRSIKSALNHLMCTFLIKLGGRDEPLHIQARDLSPTWATQGWSSPWHVSPRLLWECLLWTKPSHRTSCLHNILNPLLSVSTTVYWKYSSSYAIWGHREFLLENGMSLGMATSWMYWLVSIFSIFPSYRFFCVFYYSGAGCLQLEWSLYSWFYLKIIFLCYCQE